MKIRHKLIIGYLAVTFLVAAIGYLGMIITSAAKEGFSVATKHTIPMIKALEVLRFGGLRIVSSTAEFGFIRAEKQVIGQKVAQPEKEEEQLIEQGIKLYTDALKEYEHLLNRFPSEGGGLLQDIRKKGLRLQQTSKELVRLKRQGVSGLEVLEKKEVFERDEKAFLAAVDAAISGEGKEFLRKKGELESFLEVNRNLGIAATVIGVIAAIIIGTFVSRSISNPITMLRDAAGEVGRGNLDARAEIKSSDEVGQLAASFNKMGEDLKRYHNHLEELVEERTTELRTANEQLQQEISEHKLAEEALRESEEKLRGLFNDALDMIHMVNEDGKIVDANPAELETMAYTRDEYLGKHILEIVHPDYQTVSRAALRSAFEGKEVKELKTAWITKRGERIDVEVNAVPQTERGKIVSVRAITRDITKRKRAEEALRESEERYHMLLEGSPDPVVAYDMEGKCTYINPAFTRIFGWTPEELLGKKLDYVPDENWPETQMMIHKVQAGESFSRVESRRYTKDGNLIHVSISAATHLNSAGIPAGSVHTLRDITERKRTEEALQKARDELELRVSERTDELMIANNQLRQQIEERKRAEKELKASEEKYRLLFYYDPNPLFMVDAESAKILDVNEPAIGLYQYDRKELLGMSFLDLFEPEDAGRLQEEFHRFPQDEYVFIDKLWAKKKDGDLFFINFHARAGRFQEVGSGEFGLSYIIRTVDITRRLEREAQLTQASKMATLGEMATGIAHELNQPLNVMRVGGDFLAKMIRRRKKISDEHLMKVSRNITEQVDRATNMINHLREFGRKSGFKLYPVDLNEPIRDVFTIMGQHLKLRNIEVNLQLEEGLPKILSDKNRLEQIFLNLVTNARDAMKEKGPGEINKLTVATYQERDTVVAVVSDTGCGMPERVRKKIFEPFFTTKEVGEGTGLGLSITYNLVRDFKGHIDVESTPDVGTTFRVRFPAYQEKGASGCRREIIGAKP